MLAKLHIYAAFRASTFAAPDEREREGNFSWPDLISAYIRDVFFHKYLKREKRAVHILHESVEAVMSGRDIQRHFRNVSMRLNATKRMNVKTLTCMCRAKSQTRISRAKRVSSNDLLSVRKRIHTLIYM